MLIALTGWGQDEDRRKSHEAGFDGHLVKPVDHERLSALLRHLQPPRARRTSIEISLPRPGELLACVFPDRHEPDRVRAALVNHEVAVGRDAHVPNDSDA